MKSIVVSLFAAVVGCAIVQPVFGAEGIKAKEEVLHSFGSGTDGAAPASGLIDAMGILYGTTNGGGANCADIGGCGTVFSLNPKSGAETVIYSFCGQRNCTDGDSSNGSLIDLGGTLYGTTAFGGASGSCYPQGCGTVFALDPATGAERVLYSFCSQTNCGDGERPRAGLVDAKGTLYGTAPQGGSTNCGGGCGIVFAIDPNSGAERVIYTFCSQQNCPDGSDPEAGLIAIKGTLYGTTGSGGAYDRGTVFALDRASGMETVVYSFCAQQNCADGQRPLAPPIMFRGLLYGTTELGGAYGFGSVFSVDPQTGAETVLHSFCDPQSCTDGSTPHDALIVDKGKIFGMTSFGGAGTSNAGVVFGLDPESGAETILYSFCSQPNCADGGFPAAGLLKLGQKLYGVTENGGGYGYGTAFSLKPRLNISWLRNSLNDQRPQRPGTRVHVTGWMLSDGLGCGMLLVVVT